MPLFYSLDSDTRIGSLPAYKSGMIVGMDVSSGIRFIFSNNKAVAVQALDLKPTDHVLDICCAPGAKTCLIAQTVVDGSVTGVDASYTRLAVTKNLVKRLELRRVRLFNYDARVFDVHAPTRIGPTVLKNVEGKEKGDLIKPMHASRLLRHDQQYIGFLYDSVIVDAECTHDGSIAHIKKQCEAGWKEGMRMDQDVLRDLQVSPYLLFKYDREL
jgi:16S rRNA C967 or C1407 C5-methylase (RsmB/RsmF family)